MHGPMYTFYDIKLPDTLLKTPDRDVFNQTNAIKDGFHVFQGSRMLLLLGAWGWKAQRMGNVSMLK